MLLDMLKQSPLQAFLFLYNVGIFAWLKTSSQSIMSKIGLSADWIDKLPAPIRDLAGSSLTGLETLLNSSAWGWLIVSMLLLLVIRFVKGLIKCIIMLLIVFGGLYLLWQNKEILSGLLA